MEKPNIEKLELMFYDQIYAAFKELFKISDINYLGTSEFAKKFLRKEYFYKIANLIDECEKLSEEQILSILKLLALGIVAGIPVEELYDCFLKNEYTDSGEVVSKDFLLDFNWLPKHLSEDILLEFQSFAEIVSAAFLSSATTFKRHVLYRMFQNGGRNRDNMIKLSEEEFEFFCRIRDANDADGQNDCYLLLMQERGEAIDNIEDLINLINGNLNEFVNDLHFLQEQGTF